MKTVAEQAAKVVKLSQDGWESKSTTYIGKVMDHYLDEDKNDEINAFIQSVDITKVTIPVAVTLLRKSSVVKDSLPNWKNVRDAIKERVHTVEGETHVKRRLNGMLV